MRVGSAWPGGPPATPAPCGSDAAWERLALLVEGAAASGACGDAVAALGSEASRRDLSEVREAGDGELLEEFAADVLRESLRAHVVPAFWSALAVPDAAENGDEASDAWCRRLAAALRAARRTLEAHGALLLRVAADGARGATLAEAHRMGFRVAWMELWPAPAVGQLHRYFRRTWRTFPQRWRLGDSAEDLEEWWWASPETDAKPRRSASDRVEALLRPMQWSGAAEVAGEEDGSEDEEDEEEDAERHMAVDGDGADAMDARPDVSGADLRSVAGDMQAIGLAEVWHDLVAGFILEELAETVRARCGSEYDAVGLLRSLTTWLYATLLRWLRTAYDLPTYAPPRLPDDSDLEVAWRLAARRVTFQFFENFVEVRIREAIEMVKDFPDSTPALRDLRRCLARTGRTMPLVQALRQQMTQRLLIAGAHTKDIIQAYIDTIRAMRVVDPRGLLLEAVSNPIRAYLKRRKDTVRCILTALTEDTDLQRELHTSADAGGAPPAPAPSAAELAELAFSNADPDASDEDEDPDTWVPDPIDADPQLPARQRRAQDIVSMLVGIYGSKHMFIKEYKEMLADRLLATPSYGTDREIQNLELLKTRFGETALSQCEVMLQDVKDSKRINANVQEQWKRRPAASTSRAEPEAGPGFGARGMMPFSLSFFNMNRPTTPAPTSTPPPRTRDTPGGPTPGRGPLAVVAAAPPAGSADGGAEGEQERLSVEQMQALVLSQQYWPDGLTKGDHPHLRLPAVLEDALAEYGTIYAQTRAKRTVDWKKAHGLVEITVQLQDRSIPVMVSPVHFAVLNCFTEGQEGAEAAPSRRSLQEVALRLGLPEALVRKRIGFWVAKGVLREVSAGVYDVQETLSALEGVGSSHVEEDIEYSPGLAARGPGEDAVCAGELEACEAAVLGMLNNYQALPLSRIHGFLHMFMADPLYTQTESQLRQLLQRLCHVGKLEFDGSSYMLAKKADIP